MYGLTEFLTAIVVSIAVPEMNKRDLSVSHNTPP